MLLIWLKLLLLFSFELICRISVVLMCGGFASLMSLFKQRSS